VKSIIIDSIFCLLVVICDLLTLAKFSYGKMSIQPCIAKKIFEDTHSKYEQKVLNPLINSNK
jgi:hypothetical protein